MFSARWSRITRDGTVSIQDLTQKAPGLEATTPNSRRTGIALRGLGKSAGNDALEASVGVLVDGIFLTHPGMTYQDFTDLDRSSRRAGEHLGERDVHRLISGLSAKSAEHECPEPPVISDG